MLTAPQQRRFVMLLQVLGLLGPANTYAAVGREWKRTGQLIRTCADRARLMLALAREGKLAALNGAYLSGRAINSLLGYGPYYAPGGRVEVFSPITSVDELRDRCPTETQLLKVGACGRKTAAEILAFASALRSKPR